MVSLLPSKQKVPVRSRSGGLPVSIKVVQRFLVPRIEVRILGGERKAHSFIGRTSVFQAEKASSSLAWATKIPTQQLCDLSQKKNSENAWMG